MGFKIMASEGEAIRDTHTRTHSQNEMRHIIEAKQQLNKVNEEENEPERQRGKENKK